MATQENAYSLTPQELMGRIATVLIVERNHGTVEVAPADIRARLEQRRQRVCASLPEIKQALHKMEEAGMVVFQKNLVRLPK